MADKRNDNDADEWPPHGIFAPPQRTDTENAECNSSRAPNSSTHSVNSRSSTNSELSPTENRSTSLLRNTGALFSQTSPRESTISSTDGTTMSIYTHNTSAVPVQTARDQTATPQPPPHTGPLSAGRRGNKRQGSDMEDAQRVVVGRPAAAAARGLKYRARDNDNSLEAESSGTIAGSFGAGWQLMDSPTSASHHGGDLDGQSSSGMTGDDSDDEGKTKGSKRRGPE